MRIRPNSSPVTTHDPVGAQSMFVLMPSICTTTVCTTRLIVTFPDTFGVLLVAASVAVTTTPFAAVLPDTSSFACPFASVTGCGTENFTSFAGEADIVNVALLAAVPSPQRTSIVRCATACPFAQTFGVSAVTCTEIAEKTTWSAGALIALCSVPIDTRVSSR